MPETHQEDPPSGSPTAPPRRPRDPGPGLWAVTGAGWVVIVTLLFVPDGHLTHPAHVLHGLAGATGSLPWLLGLFAVGWLVMVAAMMLPTTVPMARMFAVVSARRPGRGPVRTAFFGAYAVVWLGFALAALAGLAVLAPVLRAADPDYVLAGALALAGVFQFSSLKSRCLTVCRDPGAFLFAHYRRGVAGAWSVGVRHALVCVGCCWALMLVMFATGVADLAWMLGLTAIMVVEKVTRWGTRIVTPVGVVLLGAALLFAILGALAPPPTAPHHHMPM